MRMQNTLPCCFVLACLPCLRLTVRIFNNESRVFVRTISLFLRGVREHAVEIWVANYAIVVVKDTEFLSNFVWK